MPIQIAYALVSGIVVHIFDYRSGEPTCRYCGSALIPRRGDSRAWCYAHKPNVPGVCPATRRDGDTDLHSSVQQRIAEQLKGPGPLRLFRDGRRLDVLPRSWTAVAIEHTVGERRVDVALLDGERVVLAIEVRVTHAVDADKARVLAERDVPWIEVPVDREDSDHLLEWTLSDPLPCRTGAGPGVPRAELTWGPEHFRIVDVYDPRQLRRELWVVEAGFAEGVLCARRLVRHVGDHREVLVRRDDDEGGFALSELPQWEELKRSSLLVESPMSWYPIVHLPLAKRLLLLQRVVEEHLCPPRWVWKGDQLVQVCDDDWADHYTTRDPKHEVVLSKLGYAVGAEPEPPRIQDGVRVWSRKGQLRGFALDRAEEMGRMLAGEELYGITMDLDRMARGLAGPDGDVESAKRMLARMRDRALGARSCVPAAQLGLGLTHRSPDTP